MLHNAATQALIAQILEAQRGAAPAEEAEPKAEQAPKGKAPPLAKPKSKPKPQPQAPHPPSPAPPPLVARKQGAAAVPEEEEPEVEEARGELKGLLDSRAASKAAKARAETKVSAWEAKMASPREEGADAERIRWGEANLRKAKAKVAEKEEAIEGFDRAVRRSERESAAVVGRVKDEEVDEVVELEAEMEEGIVKEEEEAKVVVAAPGGGGVSQWLRGLMESRDAGAIQALPWDLAVLAGPHPPNLDTHRVAPESPVWTLRFLLVHGGGGGPPRNGGEDV